MFSSGYLKTGIEAYFCAPRGGMVDVWQDTNPLHKNVCQHTCMGIFPVEEDISRSDVKY